MVNSLKLAKIGLLIFLILNLVGCSSGIKLTEKEIRIYEGQSLDPLDYISDKYKDNKDVIIESKVNTAQIGKYEVIYKLKDTQSVLTVKVLSAPLSTKVENLVIETGSILNPLDYITTKEKASDINVTNKVNVNNAGEYIIVYSFNGYEKVLNVTVKDVEVVLSQTSLTIDLGSTFDPRTYLGGTFPQSPKIIIVNNVNTDKVGTYQVNYTVGSVTKTLQVIVKDGSPILTVSSVSVKQDSDFEPTDYLIESDRTNTNIQYSNNANTSVPGTYTVTYQLGKVIKTLEVTVLEAVAIPLYTFKVVSLTSPLTAGSNATITVQGKAGVEYSIKVYYSSGASSAAGLEPKVANSSGKVSWTWKVGPKTTPGNWEIVVEGDDRELSTFITIK